MDRKTDLTGQRFGRLVAVSYSHSTKHGKSCWNMLCDCGNTCVAVCGDLNSGKVKSCGCLRKDLRTNDIVGQKFGRLTVLEATDSRNCGRSVIWKCSCSCSPGKIHYAATVNLISGSVSSCGCLRKEKSAELCRKRRGPLSPSWNQKLTDEERIQGRDIPEYKEWRVSVYERDNFTCQKCGDSTGGNLNAHHIEAYADNSELRTKLSNGVTLCKDCHNNYHHLYGRKHATREKFEEWIRC